MPWLSDDIVIEPRVRQQRWLDVGDLQPATTSRPLSRHPAIAAFLGRHVHWTRHSDLSSDQLLVGWGYRPSGRNALRYADTLKTRHVLFEDGFLRSVGRRDMEVGYNLDQDGIYYAAESRSRLFDLVREPLSPADKERTRSIISKWRELRLSKYNDSPPFDGTLPARYALVIDQVRNDLSIPWGMASEDSFAQMLDAALADDPDRDVVVKIHPDSANDPTKRHFDVAMLRSRDRVHVIDRPVDVVRLIAASEAVYTVTSQVGFEALLWGKPVKTFGMPFYAGWGLTDDNLQNAPGRAAATLNQLVHAALVRYPRYWNPVRGCETEVEEAMALIGLNRKLRSELPPIVYAYGFSRWKRPFITRFLSGSTLRFVKNMGDIPRGAPILIWGSKSVPDDRDDLAVLRIEDGFLRSSGLGANLVTPLSLVIDDQGLYYDCGSPSRIEALLAKKDYTEDERNRAADLRRSIIAYRLNKYNLGGDTWARPASGKVVILVVGQVEDDASIRFGSPDVKTNGELARRVRLANPDAYLVYKPHPDVVAGLRKASSDEVTVGDYCDEVLPDVDPNHLLDQVDEVHTMTSLMGFEALIRELPVTCYGLPFYAGWGLTKDRASCARRHRKRHLDELVHATLIDYPRYFSATAGIFVAPEDAFLELHALAKDGPRERSPLRKVIYWIVTRWVKWRGR